jgi:hypothetical protein
MEYMDRRKQSWLIIVKDDLLKLPDVHIIYGTYGQVRKYLVDMCKSARKSHKSNNGIDYGTEGTKSINEVEEINDKILYTYVKFGAYKIRFIAMPENCIRCEDLKG